MDAQEVLTFSIHEYNIDILSGLEITCIYDIDNLSIDLAKIASVNSEYNSPKYWYSMQHWTEGLILQHWWPPVQNNLREYHQTVCSWTFTEIKNTNHSRQLLHLQTQSARNIRLSTQLKRVGQKQTTRWLSNSQIPLCQLPSDIRNKPVTSPLAQIPICRLWGSRRNGIWAKGDVMGLSWTYGEVGLVEFGLKQTTSDKQMEEGIIGVQQLSNRFQSCSQWTLVFHITVGLLATQPCHARQLAHRCYNHLLHYITAYTDDYHHDNECWCYFRFLLSWPTFPQIFQGINTVQNKCIYNYRVPTLLLAKKSMTFPGPPW